MKIRNLILFFAVAGITLAGCNKAQYKKTPGGMPYQLFSGDGKEKAKVGDFIKMNFSVKLKNSDSVLNTSQNGLPAYIKVTGQTQPYDFSELWLNLKKGDSVIATQMVDSLLKKMPPEQVPPFFKKGDRLMLSFKVMAIFPNDSLMKLDEEKEGKLLESKEIAVIEKYLKEKNINTVKTKSGAFLEMKSEGTGSVVDSGKYVTVNYTGTNFSGVKFDSNTDAKFGHVTPLGFVAGTPAGMPNSMLKGFDEAIRMMKVGSSARVYIPSSLAYGGNPQPGSPIKPYENLIFDLTVIDVKNTPPPPPPQMQMPPQNIDMPQSNK
jgi:FKBP-type peptidyl-prolyl cis-trans isomerase